MKSNEENMPELPEVETVKLELTNKVITKKISQAIVKHSKIIQRLSQINFTEYLKNKTIKEVFRRGKYIIFVLHPMGELVIHLGMTGVLIYPYDNNYLKLNKNSLNPKHNHLLIFFTDDTQLVFNDVRKFGKVYLVKNRMEIDSIARLGIEPLSSQFSSEIFFQIIKKNPKKKIKSLLMNQKLIAGVGNIYANEALYRAHIHPLRLASSLNYQEIDLLHQKIQFVLRKAIQLKGSTISDGAFRDTNGEKGEFKQEIQIYARRREACFKCHHPIEMVRIDGRSSFYCPKCQKL